MKYPYGKTVFLTGGSSGIGLATAEHLAINGYIVYSASRNPDENGRGFESGGRICPIKMDVCDAQSVDSAAEFVLSQDVIGLVIHCAGFGIAGAGEEYQADAITELFDTNYHGVLRVNSRFLPHMRNRGCGLCIIIGSLAGIFPIPFQSHYCSTKAALDLYAGALRMELESYGVKVCLVMPGDTKTGFTDSRRFAINDDSPYYDSCRSSVQKMETDERNGCSPESVARVIHKLGVKKHPKAKITVGFSYKVLVFINKILPDKLRNSLLKRIYMRKS